MIDKKITLNDQILTTLSTLSQLDFICPNSEEIELFQTLEYKITYHDKINELTFKHNKFGIIVNIKINYKNSFNPSQIKDVKILVKDKNDKFTKESYTLLLTKEKLTEKINNKINRIHRIIDSITKIEAESQIRFPIVKNELETIFGTNTTIERYESHSVFVLYKNIKMIFSLYTTKLNLNKEYRTLITFGQHDEEVAANKAKELIDLAY